MVVMTILCVPVALAQSNISKAEGKCGEDVKWVYDGYTLTITNVNKESNTVSMDDYDMDKYKAPWIVKQLNFKKLVIGYNIKNVGSCAFANCTSLQEVEFKGSSIQEIGWAAFLNCSRLRTISIPGNVRTIETIAFAKCTSLTSVSIPFMCRVGDMAFSSCTKLKTLDLGTNAIFGNQVFSTEVKKGDKTAYSLYTGEIRRMPSYINESNCEDFGLSKRVVKKLRGNNIMQVNYDMITSEIDSLIPYGNFTRPNAYALIIGNQNYRFASEVPYAIHDARVFAQYCSKTLGIPDANIHIAEDATKQMIMEEEMEDWISTIPNRENKQLIVYYAGHGVPDSKHQNKAYLLPTDVRGTSPQRGIALDEFYQRLGDMEFNRVSVFLDACFSGINRENEGVVEGLRGAEIAAEDATFGNGNVVAFSAAQGNETAQGYPAQGHGLFTYYLLKELRYTLGDISYGELSDHIKANVSQQAQMLKMRKQQTPATGASENMQEIWRDARF